MYLRLCMNIAFSLLRLSQKFMNPSLPAVAIRLLGASSTRSKHVTPVFTFWMMPSGKTCSVVGSRNRSESSEEMTANWSVFQYVRGSWRGDVERIL